MIEPNIKKPSLFRRVVMSFVNGWRRVMDVRYNPLGMYPIQVYRHTLCWSCSLYGVCFLDFLAANYLGFFNYNIVASIVIHIAILLPLAFTNAIFVDAERDGEKWLKEWKEEQSRYKLVVNRLKTKNLVMWNPNKEA